MTFLLNLIKQKSLLFKCLAISLALHLLGIIYFYTHPILIHSSWDSLFGISSAEPELLDYEEENSDLLQKNSLIEDAFQHVLVQSSHFQQPLDLIELPKGVALSPNIEESPLGEIQVESKISWDLSSSETPSLQKEYAFHEDSLIKSLFFPQESTWTFATQIQIEHEPVQPNISELASPEDWLSSDSSDQDDLIHISDLAIEASLEIDRNAVNLTDNFPPPLQETMTLSTDSSSMLSKIKTPSEKKAAAAHSYLLASKTLKRPRTRTALPVAGGGLDLENYQLPSLALANSWDRNFKVELKFLPDEEKGGYLFSLALNPEATLKQHSLKQNIHFIIDRSNSVQKHRFSIFKRAVLKALTCLQECDAFNIYIIDKKVTKFVTSPLRVSPKSIQAAEEFLEKQNAGSLFAGSDIYASLEKILPEVKSEEEVHTAILLTDGNTLNNSPKQQNILGKWLEENSGKLSLYTAAVGQKNNLLMLDLLSSISGGKLLYSDTHASFPRKLGKLLLDLKDPIAKEMMITTIPEHADAHIEFYPASFHLPALYAHQPYVLYGYMDKPCNFELIVQGKHGDEWISIRKSISFIDGEKGNHNLVKQWQAKKANVCYSKFLDEGKAAYLKQAKEILKTNRSEIAFE